MTTIVDDPVEGASSGDVAPRTFIPDLDAIPAGEKRALSGFSRADTIDLVGAAGSALCTTLLLFGRLAPLSGPLGFVVVFFAIFLAIYAFVASLSNSRPIVVDKVMTVALASSAVVAFVALASVILFTLIRGRQALVHLNLYTHDMASAGPTSPLSQGGIAHAVVGTLIIIGISIALTVPLGIACAVYLNETRGRAGRVVRTVVDAMTALPSIIAGLFIFATWILVLGFERSGLAAAIATSIMMLPIIIRSADVVLRLVPGNLREASAATGAPQWRTVWHVVLPTARSGLATAVILGVARGVGETAPVLLTSGFTASMNVNPIKNPMLSLPLATFEFVRSPQPALIQRGFATAAVLMVLVLGLFTLARVLGGRPAGRLSKRQTRRAGRRSADDLSRIQTRALEAR